MTLKKLFVFIGIAILLVAGFFAFNSYIYKEKQGDQVNTEVKTGTGIPTFTWIFEQASTLNPDGNPNTDIFLSLTYENEVTTNKLIDTVPGSCNDLPDLEPDSLENTTNIQCYSAGLGYRYKITKGENAYKVERQTFEEGLPDHNPPPYKYEVVAELSF